MVLYHAISTYQLLEMILYRLKYDRKENAILMMTDTLNNKFSEIKKCELFFSEVWVYEINLVFPRNKPFQEVVNEYFDNFFSQHGIQVEDFEEVNAACLHYYFGHYLVSKKINFNYFEDAAGMLSRPDILMNMEKERRPIKYKKNVERGLYDGKNYYVNKVICNVSAQEEGKCQGYNVIEDFNVVSELMNISLEERKIIYSLFRLEEENIIVDNNMTVLLTQHFANLGILSFNDQINIYIKTVDYFLEGKKILIKSHPDDVMFYEDIIEGAKILKEKFPSEFLPLLIGKNINEIVTISSTAIKNYYGLNYKIFELNTDYEQTYISLHRYYVMLGLCKYLGFSLDLLCCDDNIVRNLIQRNNILKNIIVAREAEILCIDDYFHLRFSSNDTDYDYNVEFLEFVEEIISSDKYKVIIFLNSKETYSFFNKNKTIFDYIVPICINLKKEESVWWDYKNSINEKQQIIYAYSKDIKLIERIKKFEIMKQLDNSKQILEVKAISDYERKAYEGQIKALEERLKFYMNLYEKSRQE